MTDRDVTKPSALLSGGPGRRHVRWYPHEALRRISSSVLLDASDIEVDGFLPWHLLDPADAAEELPFLKEAQRDLDRFVTMIEAIAEGRPPVMCASCSQRFYPSRSDARYCGARCRMAAHRSKGA